MTPGGPRKTSRKSRKPRVRSSISSEWLKYEPSGDDWIAMEAAIGEPIKAELRASIIHIVQSYFRVQPFEANAPFLNDVLNRLKLIRQTAQKLHRALDLSWDDNLIQPVRIQLDEDFACH